MPGEWTLVQSGREWRGIVVTLHIPPLPTGLGLCVCVCVFVCTCALVYTVHVCAVYVVQVCWFYIVDVIFISLCECVYIWVLLYVVVVRCNITCSTSVCVLYCVHKCSTCISHRTGGNWRWTLAREVEQPCSLLSQLWPAVPSTTGVWGKGQTRQVTGRSLDS